MSGGARVANVFLVESRFGIGYSVNVANPGAWLIHGASFVRMDGLLVLVLTGAVA